MTYMFHGFCGQTAHCVIRSFNETSFDSSLMVVGWLRGGGSTEALNQSGCGPGSLVRQS